MSDVKKKIYPFEKYNNIVNKEKKAQAFDKDNIFVTKAGKKLNVYQSIQDARDGTEIYPTIEKYGTIQPIMMNTGEVYGELDQIKNLRDAQEVMQRGEILWKQLPLEVRAEFNNSKGEFMNRGKEWLEKRIEAEKAKTQPVVSEPVVDTQPVVDTKIKE